MRRMMIILVLLSFAFSVPQAYGGAAINITDAHVDADTLTLNGKFDLGQGTTLYVSIGGVGIDSCTVGATEIVCDIKDFGLNPGTYNVVVSAGSPTGGASGTVTDDMDVCIFDGSSGGCPTGASTSCYSGPPETRDVGACQSGTSTCVNGSWSACEGEVTPTTVVCGQFGDAGDQDCDGLREFADPECSSICTDTGGTVCDGGCVDISNDPSHCGGCNNECQSGEECLDGSCTLQCLPPFINCSGVCANIIADENNCGGCGVQCAPNQQCFFGACLGGSGDVCSVDEDCASAACVSNVCQ